MIEELRDYLVRQGWDEHVADDIHDAYYDREIDGVVEFAKTMEDGQHDYVDEVVQEVRNWQQEVGEA